LFVLCIVHRLRFLIYNASTKSTWIRPNVFYVWLGAPGTGTLLMPCMKLAEFITLIDYRLRSAG